MIDLANAIQNQKNEFENIANETEALEYVLREYKVLCNALDYDYEFHYTDDIKNNVGADLELKDFFRKYLGIRYFVVSSGSGGSPCYKLELEDL